MALAGFREPAVKLGQSGWQAKATAHFLLQDLVAREALMGAFNDCFLSLAGVALVAVLLPYS